MALILDGSIHIKWITVNGKDRPVTTDVLAKMKWLAAVEEFTTGYQSFFRGRLGVNSDCSGLGIAPSSMGKPPYILGVEPIATDMNR